VPLRVMVPVPVVVNQSIDIRGPRRLPNQSTHFPRPLRIRKDLRSEFSGRPPDRLRHRFYEGFLSDVFLGDSLLITAGNLFLRQAASLKWLLRTVMLCGKCGAIFKLAIGLAAPPVIRFENAKISFSLARATCNGRTSSTKIRGRAVILARSFP